MNKVKIIIGLVYLVILSILIYFLFNYFDFEDITSIKVIHSNQDQLNMLKENNLILLISIFFFITVLWVFLLGFGSPVALIGGFIFGKWLGTLILVFGNTIGGVLLYILAKNFFSEIIQRKFTSRFSKFIKFFNKNEMMYFMFFRFAGGGGTPFPIQNILPVIFNISIKNYIIATFFGIIPTTFVSVALGSGIENIIDQNTELNFLSVFLSPEIYFPIAGFFALLVFAFFIKKFFFKSSSQSL